MRIKKLKLENFRCFENYEIEFSDRFNLLIGDNGSGKTAVLDGLAVVLSSLLNSDIFSIKERQDNIIMPNHMRFEIVTHGETSINDTRFESVTHGQTITKEICDFSGVIMEFNLEGKSYQWNSSLTSNDQYVQKRNAKIIENPDLLTPTLQTQENIYQLFQQKTNPGIFFPLIIYFGTNRLGTK